MAAAGLREYYDPYTGKGMGATRFSWSAVVMELVDPDPGAHTIHLPTGGADAVPGAYGSTVVSGERAML